MAIPVQIITVITFFWKACSQKKRKKNIRNNRNDRIKKLKGKDVLSAESRLSLIPGGALESMNGTPELFH